MTYVTHKINDFSVLVTHNEDDTYTATFHYDYGTLPILTSDLHDIDKLLVLITDDLNRCISEISEDFLSGELEGFNGENLDDICDSNIYIAGARVPPGEDEKYPDAKYGWSDVLRMKHVHQILSSGLIGKNIEEVDPEDTAASSAYAGFDNAVLHEFYRWVRTDLLHLERPADTQITP